MNNGIVVLPSCILLVISIRFVLWCTDSWTSSRHSNWAVQVKICRYSQREYAHVSFGFGQYISFATLVWCFHFLSGCFLCSPSLSLPALCSLFYSEGTRDKSTPGFFFILFPDSPIYLSMCMHFQLALNNALSLKWARYSNAVQAWTGPEGSRRLRFPHFKTVGTGRW